MRTLLTLSLVALAAWVPAVTGAQASAAPPPRVTSLDVWSESMNRWVHNDVLSPASGGPAPVFYLLTGAGGAEDGISWFRDTDIADFFADKNVHVVLPVGGAFSMYTDWTADDPVLGRNRWQTYLTHELPAAVEREYATTGRSGIGGVSMSGGPVLDLAIQSPGQFAAVGSYSGCPIASGPVGEAIVRSMVVRGGGNPDNMWGPLGSPAWAAHDPYVQAERLRGTALFVSSGNGLPGPIDDHDPRLVVPQTIGGSATEAVTWACTGAFEQRVRSLGVPATFRYYGEGSHSWGLFETELRDSWSVLGPAIGA